MKGFILSVPPGPEGMIRLYDKDYHYLVRVRRLRAGSLFDAVLPGGAETRVRILSTVDNILIGECLGLVERIPSPIPPIALFQGLPKGSKMDLILRQAAEGGVSLVVPFEAEYSTARLREIPEKHKRWQRIIREARQQSGSTVDTTVKPPCTLDALLEHWEFIKNEYPKPVGILLHQEPIDNSDTGSPLVKGSFHGYLGNNPDFVALAVGPEGGFSPREVSLFMAAGFVPLVMGNTILRTETAALYGTAAIRIILLEIETWTSKGSHS